MHIGLGNNSSRAADFQLNSRRRFNSLFCRIFSLSSGSHLIVRCSSIGVYGAFALIIALTLPASAAESFTVVERANTNAVTDVGVKNDSVGNVLTFSNDLYDARNEIKIGSNNGYCIRTVAGQSWACNWTNNLPEGQIKVSGTYINGQDTTLIITGGTGKYNNATGTMRIHPRDSSGASFDYIFDLKPSLL